jgi:hypothetical protein
VKKKITKKQHQSARHEAAIRDAYWIGFGQGRTRGAEELKQDLRNLLGLSTYSHDHDSES